MKKYKTNFSKEELHAALKKTGSNIEGGANFHQQLVETLSNVLAEFVPMVREL